MENIDARDLDVLIANFLRQVRKKEGDNDTTPHRWGLSFVAWLVD